MIKKALVHYKLLWSINAITKWRNDACRKIANSHLIIGSLRQLTHSPNEVSDKRSFRLSSATLWNSLAIFMLIRRLEEKLQRRSSSYWSFGIRKWVYAMSARSDWAARPLHHVAMMLIRLDRFLARVRGGAACIVLCTRVSVVHIYSTIAGYS